MNCIVLTQDNITDSVNNSTFKYEFRNSVNLTNKEIALASLTMYYSWFNITSAIGNNKFTYTWRADTTTTTYTITLPDGLYTIADINSYMQSIFIDNGHYLINNTTGDYVYYAEFIYNTTLNQVNINTYPVPTSLPAGYSEPTNWDDYPDNYYNPIITLSSSFNEIVGYTAGYATSDNYGNNTTLNYASSTSPDLQENEALLITIQQCQNEYTRPYGVIYALTIQNSDADDVIIEKPSQFIFTNIISGVYSELYIRILKASDYSPAVINNPNMVIVLCIKDKSYKTDI